MYILVDVNDVIIGTSSGKPCEKHCSRLGYRIFYISPAEFKSDMLGSKLTSYDIVDNRE